MTALLAVTTGVPASASEAPAGLETEAGIVPIERIAMPSPLSRWRVFRTDSTRRIGVVGSTTRDSSLRAESQLSYVDLDSGHSLGVTPLSPPMWQPMISESSSPRGPLVHGSEDAPLHLDVETGRAFVVYGISAGGSSGATTGTGHPGAVAASAPSGQFCSGAVNAVQGGFCVGGVHVVDVESRDIVRSIPIRPLRVDSPGLSTVLRAVTYVPAGSEGASGGKVLLLVEDIFPHADGGLASATAGSTRGKTNQTALHYLIQVDPTAGTQDWAVRVEACRGGRGHDSDPTSWKFGSAQRPHHSAILPSLTAADRAIYVGCYTGTNDTATITRVPLEQDRAPAALPASIDGPDDPAPSDAAARSGEPGLPVQPAARQGAWVGPDRAVEYIADIASGRILVRINNANFSQPGTEVWWVFDIEEQSFIGALGMGIYQIQEAEAGLDFATGRFYLRAGASKSSPARAFVADIRATPLGQALAYPLLGDAPHDGGERVGSRIEVESPSPSRLPRLHSRSGRFEDRTPQRPLEPPTAGHETHTQDLDEVEGLTARAFDGAARGFGARAIFMGGVGAASRVGAVDPHTAARFGYTVLQERTTGTPPVDAALPAVRGQLPAWPGCADSNREVVLAAAGTDTAASLNAGGSSGAVRPIVLDGGTGQDVETPIARCAPAQWDATWQRALFGKAPADEPRGLPREYWDGQAACVSDDREPSDAWADPVASMFSGSVSCSSEEASGWSYARGSAIAPGATVTEALSSFRIYLDPRRGIVARVESVARGVSIDGHVKIDSVRGTAESWANGRAQPVPIADQAPGYDPNCDVERTAGSCFVPHLFGVRTPAYQCGPCGDEDALVEALARALGTNASVRLRKPDPDLARGSEDGFIAAVQRPDSERFADLMMNADLLPTTLPTLEIVRYASPNLPSAVAASAPGYVASPARQIYQFAAVETSSSYAIQCIAVLDTATGTCTKGVEPAGGLTIVLTDEAGTALAGGTFEVRSDVDEDGLLGLNDALLPDGICLTAADGIGSCSFSQLPPGSYIVSQTAAPSGYASVDEPWTTHIAGGETRTVTFANIRDVSSIEVTVTNEAGEPVAGATFEVYEDPDADGKVDPDTAPESSCTTGADGTCTMSVSVGSYVLLQTGGPPGLAHTHPVPFAFTSAGQIAAVHVLAQPAEVDQLFMPGTATRPVYRDHTRHHAPAETIALSDPPSRTPALPPADPLSSAGGTIVRILRAPGDALRLLSREPREAAGWTGTLLLFALAAALVRRRHEYGSLVSLTSSMAAPGAPSLPARHETKRPAPDSQTHDRDAGRLRRRGAVPHGAARAATRLQYSGAVIERPSVAGAAPDHNEILRADVIVASASELVRTLAKERLRSADQANLLDVVDSLELLRSRLETLQPDVLVVDLALPTGAPYDVCDVLPALHPPQRIVGLIPPGGPAEAYIARAEQVGIAGLLVADEDTDSGQLAYAVHCVSAGKPCYGPSVQAVQHKARHSRRRRAHRPAGITPRELEVARLAATGMKRMEIAKHLYLSPATVKLHLSAVRKKLGVTDPSDVHQLRLRLEALHLMDDD